MCHNKIIVMHVKRGPNKKKNTYILKYTHTDMPTIDIKSDTNHNNGKKL